MDSGNNQRPHVATFVGVKEKLWPKEGKTTWRTEKKLKQQNSKNVRKCCKNVIKTIKFEMKTLLETKEKKLKNATGDQQKIKFT